MKSRDRVIAALNRTAADRVPVYMWFHPVTAKRLSKRLGVPAGEVARCLGDDICQTWVNNNYAMEGIQHEHDGDQHLDFWGVRWIKEGPFNQILEFPLANASEEEVMAYCFPTGHIEELLAPMAQLALGVGDRFLGCDISPNAFEMYWRLRGMEQTLMEFVSDPELIDMMIGRCVDFGILLADEASKRFPLDWIWLGDDLAGQHGMMMHPELWRKMVKPHLRRAVEAARKHVRWVAFHSCGAIRPIIPDLIEIGIDVLNPVQSGCTGMDPLELKQEFGHDLTFMGGLDTQNLIPNGTAQDVYSATARLLEGMTAGGGGYILAASHTIPPETPDENIFAIYEAAGVQRSGS